MARKKKRGEVMVRWHFPDGDMVMPLKELLRQIKTGEAKIHNTPELAKLSDRMLESETSEMLSKAANIQHISEVNSDNAKKPRKKRGPSPTTKLKDRGLKVLLSEAPGITAGKLWDILEADAKLTFDDDDIEMQCHGGLLVIRDLSEGPEIESTTIKRTSLRTYLAEARKT
jgi:hypothetical protein